MYGCYVVVNLLKRRLRKGLFRRGKPKKSPKEKYINTRNRVDITIAVMMAKRIHLYPFRTQKLSSFTPKVLAENCREDR